MTVQMISLKDLTLLERNPRKIDKQQFSKLCKSLEEDPKFFQARPCLVNHIVANNKMVVYAGNQRVQAAKKLGWKQVPCIIDIDLDEKTMHSRIVKDNKHYGEFDFDMLFAEWDVDILLDAGFSQEELTGDYGEIESIETKEEKQKKEKLKSCPNCGYES